MSSRVLRDRLAELVGAGLLDTDDARRYGLSRYGRAVLEALTPPSRCVEQMAPLELDPSDGSLFYQLRCGG